MTKFRVYYSLETGGGSSEDVIAFTPDEARDIVVRRLELRPGDVRKVKRVKGS